MFQENKKIKANFDYCHEFKRFLKDDYNPAMTNDRLSVEEVRDFFSKLELLLNHSPYRDLAGDLHRVALAYIGRTTNYYREKGVAWVISRNSFKVQLWEYDEVQLESPGDSPVLIHNFPYTKDSKKFNADYYFPVMTDDKVSRQEIKEFLSHMEQQATNCSKASGTLNKFPLIFRVLFLVFFFAYIFLAAAYVEPSSPKSARLFVIVGTFFFIFVISGPIIYTRLEVYKSKKIQEAVLNVQAQLDLTTDHFIQKGLRWVIPSDFPESIELWRDKLIYSQPNLLEFQELLHPNNISGTYDNNEIHRPLMQRYQIQQRQQVGQQRIALVKKRCVRFPYDTNLKKFLHHHYFSGLTEDGISAEEIKEFLVGVESRLTGHTQYFYLASLLMFPLVLLILFTSFPIITCLSSSYEDSDSTLLIIEASFFLFK